MKRFLLLSTSIFCLSKVFAAEQTPILLNDFVESLNGKVMATMPKRSQAANQPIYNQAFKDAIPVIKSDLEAQLQSRVSFYGRVSSVRDCETFYPKEIKTLGAVMSWDANLLSRVAMQNDFTTPTYYLGYKGSVVSCFGSNAWIPSSWASFLPTATGGQWLEIVASVQVLDLQNATTGKMPLLVGMHVEEIRPIPAIEGAPDLDAVRRGLSSLSGISFSCATVEKDRLWMQATTVSGAPVIFRADKPIFTWAHGEGDGSVIRCTTNGSTYVMAETNLNENGVAIASGWTLCKEVEFVFQGKWQRGSAPWSIQSGKVVSVGPSTFSTALKSPEVSPPDFPKDFADYEGLVISFDVVRDLKLIRHRLKVKELGLAADGEWLKAFNYPFKNYWFGSQRVADRRIEAIVFDTGGVSYIGVQPTIVLSSNGHFDVQCINWVEWQAHTTTFRKGSLEGIKGGITATWSPRPNTTLVFDPKAKQFIFNGEVKEIKYNDTFWPEWIDTLRIEKERKEPKWLKDADGFNWGADMIPGSSRK